MVAKVAQLDEVEELSAADRLLRSEGKNWHGHAGAPPAPLMPEIAVVPEPHARRRPIGCLGICETERLRALFREQFLSTNNSRLTNT